MNQKDDKKRERFERLATLRTNVVLKRLKVLGNCSNRSAYTYTEEQIKEIGFEGRVKLVMEPERKNTAMAILFAFKFMKENL